MLRSKRSFLSLSLPLLLAASGYGCSSTGGNDGNSGTGGALTGSGSTTGSGSDASTGSTNAGTGSNGNATGGNGSLDDGPWHDVAIRGGGYVTGLHYHPTEAGLLYARTDMGGAYRYDPENSRWIQLLDFLTRDEADSMGVLSLALDPSDPEKVYLATGKYTQSWAGNGFFFASSDRGKTFTKTALPVKIGGNEDGRGTGERLAVDPNLGTHLLLGTTKDGLYESENGGTTFTKLASLPETNVNFVHFVDGGETSGKTQTIFVGIASTTNALYRSDNGGATFTKVSGTPSGQMPLRAALAGGKLFITFGNGPGPNGVTAGSVQALTIAGGAIDDISPPTGSYGFGGISVDPANPEHLVASTLDLWYPHDELYYSTNGGDSWSPLLDAATFETAKAPYTAVKTQHWMTDVAIDPNDPTSAWFVTGYGVFRCGSLAAPPITCSFENDGIEQVVAMELISPSEGAPLLSALGDVDGFVHDTLDVSPAAGNYSPNVGTTLGLDFAETKPNFIVKAYNASPYGGRSEDGGKTWTPFSTSPAGAAAGGSRSIAVNATGTAIVWGPKGGSDAAMGLFYSTNNGGNWTASTGTYPTGLLPVADRVDGTYFYAFDGTAGTVYVSSTSGASFAAGATGLPTLEGWALAQAELTTTPGNAGHVWLASAAGGLHRSTNHGANFEKVTSVGAAYRVGFGKAKTDGGYPAIFLWGEVGGTLGIYRSDDEGATFERINDDEHQFGWIHSVIGDPRTYGRVYIGTEGRGIHYRDL